MIREYRWDSGNIVIAPHGGMEEGGYVPGDNSRLMPGTAVTHRLSGGSGMIIECGEKTCRVLWSDPPSKHRSRSQPGPPIWIWTNADIGMLRCFKGF